MNNNTIVPPSSTPDVCTVAVLVDGVEIPGKYHIVSLSVSGELNRIPSATLQLLDGDAARSNFQASNTELFVPGNFVEIQLGYRSRNQTVFKGIIIRHSIKIRENASLLNIECRHQAVKMTKSIRSRYFTGLKDSEIMEELIGNHGIQHDIHATTANPKEVVQYEATDWDFFVCRAEANGYMVLAEDNRLVAGPPDMAQETALAIQYGAAILELDAEIDARRQSGGIRTSSWHPANQQLVERDASEPDITRSGNLDPQTLSEATGDEIRILRHVGRLSEPELQTWADSRLMTERLSKIRGRVRIQGCSSIKPGSLITLNGIGERFEGTHYVSGVRHEVSNGNWKTDIQFGLNPERFMETFNLRPLPSTGLLPGPGGLQTGVVTALEGDPEGEERVKIRLPMVSMEDEGAWARIATLDAGNSRGTFFRPEIDDEVIVGFLNDDPRHPVVLGMCHSSAKSAPETAMDTNHVKGYVSREQMRVLFNDEEKSILIKTPGGNSIELSEDKNGVVITDENGNSITLDKNGITIESIKDLKLKAAGEFTAEGSGIDLKAQMALTVSGQNSAEISATTTTIKGSASAVISGGIVQIN